MAIIHNGKTVIGRYHGGTEIVAKYHGSNLVWQKNRLPVEYREVEYIESTGSQYIDTGYVRTGNINKVEIKYNYLSTNTTNGCTVYGYSKSLVRTPYITNFNETGSSKLAIYGSGGKWLSFNSARDTVHTSVIETNNQSKTWKFTHDKQELANGSFPSGTTTLCGVSSALFAVKNPTDEKPNNVTEFSKSRIYSYKEYDDNDLVRNFIPCVRVDDRKAGMYDTVTKKFYSSETSTNFKHGAYKDTFERICTELEYIESTGSQYIDTEINATNELKLYSKVSTRSSTELLVFGASANETRLGMLSSKSLAPVGNIVFQYGKQNVVTSVVTPKNTIMELTLDGNLLYKDGELIYKGTKETFDVGRNLYMFATNSTASDRYGIIKLYKAYIKKDGTLLRNFIPCKYKATGKIGMYDTVSGDIFVSETKSEFIASGELPEEYTPKSYIQSTGTQYINTDYIPTQNTKFGIDVAYTDITKTQINGCYFGSNDNPNNRFYIGVSAYQGSGIKFIFGLGNNRVYPKNIDTNRHTLELDAKNKKYKLDDTVGDITYTWNDTGRVSLALFSANYSNGNTQMNYAKMYACKIYDDDVLIRNFIPCVRKSDNIAGMYDTIGKKFYKSATSTNFSAG